MLELLELLTLDLLLLLDSLPEEELEEPENASLDGGDSIFVFGFDFVLGEAAGEACFGGEASLVLEELEEDEEESSVLSFSWSGFGACFSVIFATLSGDFVGVNDQKSTWIELSVI